MAWTSSRTTNPEITPKASLTSHASNSTIFYYSNVNYTNLSTKALEVFYKLTPTPSSSQESVTSSFFQSTQLKEVIRTQMTLTRVCSSQWVLLMLNLC